MLKFLHIIPIIIFTEYTYSINIYMKFPILNETNPYSHLKYDHINEICRSRDSICKNNNSAVCSMRFLNETIEYKGFVNSCYLFLSNMCDYPGSEFYITKEELCKNLRRNNEKINVTTETTSTQISKAPKIGRTGTTPFKFLYDIESAFDYHICPLSCPETYSPVCVTANRGFGKYFKFFTFANHCLGDLYYCKHWEEFSPPPDEDEMVVSSPLGWSFCGASRYLQFARFSEAASSMGHYGWLAGDYRYSHIMEPHERMPNYG